ncbi:MAG: DUF2184 domain-containing protein [Deltaproteobacteria bacterium]|nr:DUF2184 domain-containing protein [Deltaproteobacteria bacterium]
MTQNKEQKTMNTKRIFFKDNAVMDRATIDSTGVFLATELQRLDPVLHEPMADFSYSRDIDMTALDIGDEQTAFDRIHYTATGGETTGGKSFVSSKVTEIGTVGLDSERVVAGTFVWAEAIRKSVIELAQAQKLGRPLDPQMMNALQMKLNIDSQNMVYTGDTPAGVKGLCNSSLVTETVVANNAANASALWTAKSDEEVLKDINTVLDLAWAATGYTICPSRLGLPPVKFSYLATRKIANQTMSLGKYLADNSLCNIVNGRPLEIVPMRELAGIATGPTDRMVAYSKRPDVVRWPRSIISSMPVENRGLHQISVYYCRFGTVEFVKPEACYYAYGF